MDIQNYKNKVSHDLQYWSDVNKLKQPVYELCDLVPPLTDAEKQLLPAGVRNFYYYGRWFFYFISCVVVPYNRVLMLYCQRHLSALFKSFMVYDEHEIELPMSGDAFDLFSSIPTYSAKELCRLITVDTNVADMLLNCVEDGDRQGFHSIFSSLELPKTTLQAITKTIDFQKSLMFYKGIGELEGIDDSKAAKFVIKSHISEICVEKELGYEVIEFTLNLIEVFFTLVENIYDKNLHEEIEETYFYEVWLILAKRLFSMSVYQMRRIWDVLSQEEKDLANEVLNPASEFTHIVNGERINLSQDVIQLALRWSKISRSKVLNMNSGVPKLQKLVAENDKSPNGTTDYRECFATCPPKLNYRQLRDLACRLAGTAKVDNSITHSRMAYIKSEDVRRFCYFFLHEVNEPDNIANIDFSKPIWWLGDWKSLKYFIWRLYGKPKTNPSNMAKRVVQGFRFKTYVRNRSGEEGKISFTTYNGTRGKNTDSSKLDERGNAASILALVSDDDKKRIDALFKDYEHIL